MGSNSNSNSDLVDTLAVPASSGKKASFSTNASSHQSFVTRPSPRGSIAIIPSNKSSFSMPPPTSSTRASFAALAPPANVPFAIQPVTETEPAPEVGSGRRGSTVNDKKTSVLIATNKPRTGRTVLKAGQTVRHYLDGETRAGAYHEEAEGGVQARKQSVVASTSWVG